MDVYPKGTSTGDIVFEETYRSFQGISDSENKGIAIIYQELALVPEMTVYENIFLGHEIKKNGVIDWHDTKVEAAKMLKKSKTCCPSRIKNNRSWCWCTTINRNC